jgi:hypothetical protein
MNMPGLSPLQPDQDYCVYCHSPAAGRCGVCHAWLCADCTELAPGLSRPLALCRECFSRAPAVGWRLIAWLVIPGLILVLLVLLILLLG